LNDKRVRQALFMATDRDYLVKNAFFNTGSVGIAPFTTEIAWAADPAVDYRKMYPFDVARANALLDEAGVKRDQNGKRFSVRMVTFATQYPEYQQVAVALKSMWQAIGVDVTVDALEDATYVKRVYIDGDFDVAFNNYTTYSDPALGIARTFVTSSIGKPFGNAARYSNPEVDALFEQGERATSYAERGPFYQRIQRILAGDLPVLTLRQHHEMNAAAKSFEGIAGKVQGLGLWTDAWIAH
jgi:peptide/nickel transport system substrate-binding protein